MGPYSPVYLCSVQELPRQNPKRNQVQLGTFPNIVTTPARDKGTPCYHLCPSMVSVSGKCLQAA